MLLSAPSAFFLNQILIVALSLKQTKPTFDLGP